MNIADLLWEAGLRRGLRPETMKTYIYTVGKFLRTYHLEPFQVTKQDIEKHLLQLIRWNRAGSTVTVHLHALQFFYRHVLGKRLFIALPPIRVRKRLPTYLSQEEISSFFSVLDNMAHRLLILLTYGAGLRVSEVVSLHVRDIDLRSGYGWVRNGKGGKDRLFITPQLLTDDLAKWITQHQLQSEDWLFPGNQDGHYSDSSVRRIVAQARIKAGITRPVTPHTLRHSFATHLLENGYSLIEVNRLLGHSRMETTMVYTHLANPQLTRIQSPLDTLPQTS